MKILVLNCGSSSLKYQLIDMETEEVLVKGNYERIGQYNSFLTHKIKGKKHKFEHPAENHEEAISFIIRLLKGKGHGVIESLDEITAIGHRIVHGGEKFAESILITPETLEEIEKCAELAPLHNPPAVLGIKACQRVMKDKPMVAVFDTAFHQTIEKYRYIYPIPYEYYEKYGIRKYGFHGTSHKYVAKRITEIMGKNAQSLKIVNCHLGQGASICAIQDGKSVETSMGLTPLGGIPMGTRSGDLDPSIITYLMEKEGLSPEKMENILNKKSGAYGISEISIDFRDIEEAAATGSQRAKFSLATYNYLVACYIARCIVAMEGIDVLTFTAGVGEKGPEAREAICKHLEFFGVQLDLEKNQVRGKEQEISKEGSPVKIYIVPTNEELMIAKETAELVK